MNPISVAVVGTGWCGGIRAETLAGHALVKELHLAETRAERLAELKQKLNPAELDTLFDALSTGLGPLIEYRGAQGQATVLAMIGTGTVRSADYVASARYQKGEAEIRIGLLMVDDRWMIQGFYVNSNALLGNLAGRKS